MSEKTPELPKEDGIIDIEELMFPVDEQGKALPDKVPLVIYDRQLDGELLEEAMVLDKFIKERDTSSKVYNEFCAKAEEILKKGEQKYKQLVEDKKMTMAEAQTNIDNNKASIELKKITEHRQYVMIVNSIEQSRMLIRELKKIVEDKKVVKYISAVPMNNAEGATVLRGSRGKICKTPTGEDTTDWVNSMIVFCVKDPVFTEDTVKLIKPDMKIALRETILEISGLKTRSYKDVLIQNTNMSEKKEPSSKEDN